MCTVVSPTETWTGRGGGGFTVLGAGAALDACFGCGAGTGRVRVARFEELGLAARTMPTATAAHKISTATPTPMRTPRRRLRRRPALLGGRAADSLSLFGPRNGVRAKSQLGRSAPRATLRVLPIDGRASDDAGSLLAPAGLTPALATPRERIARLSASTFQGRCLPSTGRR